VNLNISHRYSHRYLVFSSSIILLSLLVIGCVPPDTAVPTLIATTVLTTPEAMAEPVPNAVADRPLPSTNTPIHSPTLDPSPRPSNTFTPTSLPTDTPVPTITPTSLPQVEPTLEFTDAPPFLEGIPTPGTAVPTAVPTFEVPDETTNVLLIGSDTPLGSGETRSDTMIVVTVNRSSQTASMISLPRDLYVYIPGKTMGRLNTAITLGGVPLLRQTVLYNFGIPIHYYARIDFEGFKTAVDAIGGVDVAVSCQLQDWRLKSPELDVEDEDNWEQFLLEAGVHHMDGDLALWYARSRLSSSDFDRGRRQQQLLRALLNQGVDLGLVTEFPTLWNAYQDNVDTDMDIGRMLQFAALAPTIRENGVQHLYLARGVQPWITPKEAQVQLPIWEGPGNMQETFSRLYRVPALNSASRRPITVEIINRTNNPDLPLLAADNLAWYGFIPVIAPDQPEADTQTQLLYYHPNFKDSYDWLISWIFGVRQAAIELTEDESVEYDYRVFLGEDYDPCVNRLYQPQEFIDQ
jgi:LCP family protein required for cell wall assembly